MWKLFWKMNSDFPLHIVSQRDSWAWGTRNTTFHTQLSSYLNTAAVKLLQGQSHFMLQKWDF